MYFKDITAKSNINRKKLNTTYDKGTAMRQTRLVLAWLVTKNIKQTKVAKELEVSTSLVNGTIFNRNNNRRVLAKLAALGCPMDLLGDQQEVR
jgi:hypothetical protein